MSFFALQGCCCGETPCGPGGPCAGINFITRIACGGASQYAAVVDLSGGATSPWTNFATLGVPGSRVRLAVTFGTPVIAPGKHSGSWSPIGIAYWEGRYKKLTINGTSVEFDGTIGLGTEAEATLEDQPPFAGYPYLNDGFGNHVAIITDEKVDAESILVNSTLGAFTLDYPATAGASVTVTRAKQAATQSISGGSLVGSKAFYAGIGTATTGVGGDSASYDGSPLCEGPLNGNLADSFFGTTIGTWSAEYVHPDSIGISKEEYAARFCPCAIAMTGTLWVTVRTDTGKAVSPGKLPYLVEEEIDPDTGDPITEAQPMTGDKIALAEATVDIRLTREAGSACDSPPAIWSNGVGTVSVGGVAHPVGVVEVRRIGPRLYAISLEFTDTESNDEEGHNTTDGGQVVNFHVVVSGDCPIDVQDTEQFAQAHHYSGTSPSSTSPDYVPVNPSISDPFTANAIALEEVAREIGDPACGCNEVGAYDGEGRAAMELIQGVLDEADA